MGAMCLADGQLRGDNIVHPQREPPRVERNCHMKHGTRQTDVLVGSRVRVRRLELGLSQTALANELGVTFQQVQKYEKGTNRIGASRLHAMASALGARGLKAMARVLGVPATSSSPPTDGPQGMAKPTEVLNLLSIPGAVD